MTTCLPTSLMPNRIPLIENDAGNQRRFTAPSALISQ